MRNRFDQQLDLLGNQLIQMGALCEKALASVNKALLSGDWSLADWAIQAEQELNQKEREIENLCLKLFMRQQPVAKDLRFISSALKMITDMERIGDQAQDIGEILKLDHIKPEPITGHIEKMMEATRRMVTYSVDAYVRKDLELAREVIASDDVVDRLFCAVKEDVIKQIQQDGGNAESAMDLFMIAKYFERIGDHATNIAEWVEFSITGVHRKEEEG